MTTTSHELVELEREIALTRAMVQVVLTTLRTSGAISASALMTYRQYVVAEHGHTRAGKRILSFLEALG